MTDWFWNKLNTFSNWIVFLLLFGLVIFYGNLEIKDVDLWLHIASGQYICQHHIIPHQDFLSATIAGKPWINHEWLFQVAVYNIYHLFGVDGLITFRVLLIGLIFFVLFLLGYQKEKKPLMAFLLVFVLMVYQYRLELRPDMLSVLFFVVMIFILTHLIYSRWLIFSLFILQLLWVNIHGFFIFGPILIALMIIAEVIKRFIPLPWNWNQTGRYSTQELRRLILSLGIVLAACIYNPNGVEGFIYPFKTLFSLNDSSAIFFKNIIELESPISWNNIFTSTKYIEYKILILFSFCSFFFNYRRIDIGLLALWILMLIFSLAAVRNVIFFAVTAYLITLINLGQNNLRSIFSEEMTTDKMRSIWCVVLNIFLALWILSIGIDFSKHGYFDYDRLERKSELGGLSLRAFPHRAVDFLVQNHIQGNFFNDFNSGAYLLGRTFPNIKVYIDGRTEVYGPEFFKDYNKIWKGEDLDLLEEDINKYRLIGAFVGSVHQAAPKRLVQYFYKNNDWKLVYFNHDALIFLKNIDRNQALITKHQIQLDHWQVDKLDLDVIGFKNIKPYQHVRRAETLLNLEEYNSALDEIEEALNISPNYDLAFKILGRINLAQENYSLAHENLRKSLILNSQDNETRFYYSVSLLHLNKVEKSYDNLKKVLKDSPKNSKALFLLSLIYVKQSKEDQALAILRFLKNDEVELQYLLNELDPKNEVAQALIKKL